MPNKITALLAVVAGVASLAVLTGCEKSLKTGSIEPQIQKTLEQRGVKVEAVDCPGDVTAKKGDKFECTVKANGGKELKVEVTQTDDKGHVVFVPRLDAGTQ